MREAQVDPEDGSGKERSGRKGLVEGWEGGDRSRGQSWCQEPEHTLLSEAGAVLADVGFGRTVNWQAMSRLSDTTVRVSCWREGAWAELRGTVLPAPWRVTMERTGQAAWGSQKPGAIRTRGRWAAGPPMRPPSWLFKPHYIPSLSPFLAYRVVIRQWQE